MLEFVPDKRDLAILGQRAVHHDHHEPLGLRPAEELDGGLATRKGMGLSDDVGDHVTGLELFREAGHRGRAFDGRGDEIPARRAGRAKVRVDGLRAAGIPYDLRRADPYGIYDRFEFDIPVRYNSDLLDRYLVRIDEIHNALRILEQALKQIPEGPVMAGKPQYTHRVPPGEAYSRVEGPKGELGYYVVSNGKGNPYRYHIRTPSFVNITSLEKMCIGGKIADFVTILGMVDIVLGELDR